MVDEKLSLALFAGDWLFAQHVWGERMDTDTYLATVQHNVESEDYYGRLLALRGEVGPFLEGCFERFDFAAYDVIGFTTTFQQNLASLTLARMIRERFPEKVIVFGGGNCEGVMGLELHRSFPWIDYVCSGECDNSFPLFLKRLAAGETLAGIPGLIAREDGRSVVMGPADKVHNMDAMPDPDFSDYFDAVRSAPFAERVKPQLLLESARGCWWGAKQHCTFCGLNGETMVFRAKSAERVLAEVERQVARYGVRHIQAVDNIISHDYFRTLLPMLKERRLGVSFFYEVKSNLRRDQLLLMREAGILAVQPGIESLSSHVLKLMRKGVTGIQNIQLLKWCREYGIEVAWNLLYGFPGETPEDYEEIARYASAIPHLKPPGTVAPIRLDRFSPNFTQAESFGIVDIRPFSMYRFVYPLPDEAVANLAYFFEYRFHDGRNPAAYTGKVREQIELWKQNKAGSLYKRYNDGHAEMTIVDTRPGRAQMLYPFRGLQRELYEYCEEVRSRAAILEFAKSKAGDSPELEASLDAFLRSMEEWQLMVREGQYYLSVAISVQGVRQQMAAAA
jgi:ribosomal peptide maturation radical SAM protein 1